VVAHQGHLRHPRGEVLAHQASCLNRVTNAVIVWNTVYMAAAVEQLKQEGYPLEETDLVHIWPMRYAHLNIYGKYRFNVEETHGRQGLRPLRQPADLRQQGIPVGQPSSLFIPASTMSRHAQVVHVSGEKPMRWRSPGFPCKSPGSYPLRMNF
jgi:hypothetical protein